MKNYAAALLIATTLTGFMAHAGSMDLPIDSSGVESVRSTKPTKSSSGSEASSADSYSLVGGTEGKAIQEAVSQVIAKLPDRIDCTAIQYDPQSGVPGQTTDSYLNHDELSSAIYGRESDESIVLSRSASQPALRFIRANSNLRVLSQLLITTDSTGSQIKEIYMYYYSNVEDYKKNLGTMINPNLVDVPAHAGLNTVYSCKP